jgi:uridine kinase
VVLHEDREIEKSAALRIKQAGVSCVVVSFRITPHVIGIAGGSGSGKTTLAKALVKVLVEAVVLPMDAYYLDLTDQDLTARERWNFDRPEAFDWEHFVTDLCSLRRGETIQRPVYDFTTHTRRPEVEPVEARPFLIVEGLLVLQCPDVRALLDTAVFLQVDDRTAIDRRVARDHRERGRAPETVRARYDRDVQPMFERYVRPTARWADLTLSGLEPIESLTRRVVTSVSA